MGGEEIQDRRLMKMKLYGVDGMECSRKWCLPEDLPLKLFLHLTINITSPLQHPRILAMDFICRGATAMAHPLVCID